MDQFNDTMRFQLENAVSMNAHDILMSVYGSLKEKGYDPINQIVGTCSRATRPTSPATATRATSSASSNATSCWRSWCVPTCWTKNNDGSGGKRAQGIGACARLPWEKRWKTL